MSGDHNQFQKPKSYLDDMNEVRKALEMALMALEDANDMFSNDCSVEDVYADEIEALTKVLEKKSFECPRCGHCCQADQPAQQEPVAWMHTTGTGHVYFRKKPQDKVFNPQPVYTAPPKREWVGLTDEEIDALSQAPSLTDELMDCVDRLGSEADTVDPRVWQHLLVYAPKPEEEPVAWITDGGKGELWWHRSSKFDEEGSLIGPNQDDIPLYTAPPKKQWVGLTLNEAEDFYEKYTDRAELINAIDRFLEEKNA
jgi:hypothetical protein